MVYSSLRLYCSSFLSLLLLSSVAQASYDYSSSQRRQYPERSNPSSRQESYQERNDTRYAPDPSYQRQYQQAVPHRNQEAVDSFTDEQLQAIKDTTLTQIIRNTVRFAKQGNRNRIMGEFIKSVQAALSRVPRNSNYTDLLAMLNGLPKIIQETANTTPFLTSKIVYQSLSEEGKKNFRNGNWAPLDSLNVYQKKSEREKNTLILNEDGLKILLIQLLEENRTRCSSRQECQRQDQQTIESFRKSLPPKLALFANLGTYLGALRSKPANESPLPIILEEVKREMSEEAWSKLLQAQPALEEFMLSDESMWEEIKPQAAQQLSYPWQEGKVERKEEKKKKNELANSAKNQLNTTKDKISNTAKSQLKNAQEKIGHAAEDQISKLGQQLLGNILGDSKGNGSNLLGGLLG